MPTYNGYTFEVFCDGAALDEYETEVRDNVCSCWIASEAGKVSHKRFSSQTSFPYVVSQGFYIHWTGPVTDVGLECAVSLDGTILDRESVTPGDAIDAEIKGCSVGESTLKLFAFSKVSLTGSSFAH